MAWTRQPGARTRWGKEWGQGVGRADASPPQAFHERPRPRWTCRGGSCPAPPRPHAPARRASPRWLLLRPQSVLAATVVESLPTLKSRKQVQRGKSQPLPGGRRGPGQVLVPAQGTRARACRGSQAPGGPARSAAQLWTHRALRQTLRPTSSAHSHEGHGRRHGGASED